MLHALKNSFVEKCILAKSERYTEEKKISLDRNNIIAAVRSI